MIYLLEDDSAIRELISYSLNHTGNTALGFATPSAFWAAMKQETPELIMLDIMLPEEDGLSILKKLRSSPETHKIPIIMLTAKGSEIDKVVALDLGADDYITKPFGVMELNARIKALLRRSDFSAESSEKQEKSFSCGVLSVSVSKHTVRVGNTDVPLTFKEFELLCYLLENKGLVLTRNAILENVWGYSFDGENRTVDVHIRTLRSKLGECGNMIETVRGIGYKIGEP